MSWLGNLLHGKAATPDDVEWMQGKLLFDRTPVRERYVRYFVLLSLSTVIAAYGVITNSSATVIGAMIVAPLMTPIMAVSLSVITGDTKNIIRSVFLVAAGAATVMGFSMLLAFVLPGELSVVGNAQVSARTSPREIDLVIALAAGAAGAFATGREDVSDALPGVAIAVSLVPPLSVIGICINARQFDAAWGAFMLFLTNFLAMAAAGLLVFAIMGFGGAALSRESQKSRRMATVAIIIATLVISVPLGFAGYNETNDAALQRDGQQSVSAWLEGTDYEMIQVKADEEQVDVTIAGEGPMPDFEGLLSEFEKRTGKVEVNLKVIPEQRFTGTTGT